MKHKPLQIIGIILGIALIVALVRWRSPQVNIGEKTNSVATNYDGIITNENRVK